MKTLFLFMAFLLGSLATITAQDFYLPVSTNSETAKAAYHQAEQLASNINFREANAQLDKAKAVFEKYISLLPDEANPYDSMADYYKANKEYARSAEYYEKAALLGMTDARERAAEVRLLIEKGAQ